VEWTSLTEINIDRYGVEKSKTGAQFADAGTVMARGNATSATYDWFDASPHNGSNYYRIRAIGNTGEVQYTQVVRVNMGKGIDKITVYPNPVNGNNLVLEINLQKGVYTLALTNALGQQVYRKVINHVGGAATQTLELGKNIAQGLYQLQVTNGQEKYTQQVIKN
jgi:hypothetical protein